MLEYLFLGGLYLWSSSWVLEPLDFRRQAATEKGSCEHMNSWSKYTTKVLFKDQSGFKHQVPKKECEKHK